MYSYGGGRPSGRGGNRMQSYGGNGGMQDMDPYGGGQTTDWQLGSPQSQAMFGVSNQPQYLPGGPAGGMQDVAGALGQGNPWMQAGMSPNSMMNGLAGQASQYGNKPGGTFGMANPWQGQFGQTMGQMPGAGAQAPGMEAGPGRLERLRGKMQDARAGGNMDRYNRLAQRRQNVIGRRQNAQQGGGPQSVNLGGNFDSVDYAGAGYGNQNTMDYAQGPGWGGQQPGWGWRGGW